MLTASPSPLAVLLLLAAAPSPAPRDRVAEARLRRSSDLEAMAARAGVTLPLGQVYLRAFKQERVLELWGGSPGAPLRLVRTYPFCAASGELGPKRREGDLQVPEGLYEVTEFNPRSSYHLSMKVGYPNASDRLRGHRPALGGLIYVHGSCASIGCIAIRDLPIEEVYLLTQSARTRPIRIDLYPMRLTDEALEAAKGSPHEALWRELAPAYRSFEAARRPPRYRVHPTSGAYEVLDTGSAQRLPQGG